MRLESGSAERNRCVMGKIIPLRIFPTALDSSDTAAVEMPHCGGASRFRFYFHKDNCGIGLGWAGLKSLNMPADNLLSTCKEHVQI